MFGTIARVLPVIRLAGMIGLLIGTAPAAANASPFECDPNGCDCGDLSVCDPSTMRCTGDCNVNSGECITCNFGAQCQVDGRCVPAD